MSKESLNSLRDYLHPPPRGEGEGMMCEGEGHSVGFPSVSA